MTSSFSSEMANHVAEVMSELRDQQRRIAELTEELKDLSLTKRSKDRLFSVTVARNGDLKDIKFHGDYRSMPPAQFSALLVETVNSARHELMEKAREKFADESLLGVRLRDSLAGGQGTEDLLRRLRNAFDSGDPGRFADEEGE